MRPDTTAGGVDGVAEPSRLTSSGTPVRAAADLSARRLIGFSDAVVAIAITLLVLPLVDLVPEAARAGDNAADIVTDNLVPIGGFLLGFAVIWRIWSVHHQVFARAETISGGVVTLNMLWLACVVILPFPVEMIGFYGADPFVLALYLGVLLASSLTLAVMALALRRADPHRIDPDRTVLRHDVLEQVIGNAVGLAVAFLVVLLAPGAGFTPLLLLLADRPVLTAVRRVIRRSRPTAQPR